MIKAILNGVYPMLFQIYNKNNNRYSHAGVLEFGAEEGCVYLPPWVGIILKFLLFRVCFIFIYLHLYSFLFFWIVDGNTFIGRKQSC
jgi:hypothetical protein